MVPAMSDQAMPVPPPAPGPVYYAPPQPFTGWPAPRRKVWPVVVVVVVVVGLVVVGGMFVMAADVYAKNGICNSFASSGASSTGASSSGAGAPDPANCASRPPRHGRWRTCSSSTAA